MVGNSVNFVLFHDMGNVFQNASQMFPSFLHFNQPDRQTCSECVGNASGHATSIIFRTLLDLGARYKTPVGPIRAGLQLQPESAGVSGDLRLQQQSSVCGAGGHFNFFFSIGESF